MAKPEWMPQRLYQWTKPRSLMLHGLFAVIASGCLIAFWWQVQRAMQGNVLSYLYSVEWPAIAIVVGIGWWLLVHDTPEDIARRSEYHRRMRAASAEVVARTLPRSAMAVTVGSEEVSGRALGSSPSLALGDGRGAGSPAPTSSPAEAALVPAGRLPAQPDQPGSGLDARLLDAEDGDGAGPSDELTEYNRYLATLAVKGRAKTWRNPHGV